MKVKYQYDYHKYMEIDVDESQVSLVKDLNKECERTLKEEKKYQSKTITFPSEEEFDRAVFESNRDELDDPSNRLRPDEEEKEELELKQLHKALKQLNPNQRKILVDHLRNGKSLNVIAKELNITWHAVDKSYKRALKKVRKILGITTK